MERGIVIGGSYGKILVREKTGKPLELGELLISEVEDAKILLQVFDIMFGSQFSQQNLELLSGLQLEEKSDLEFMDPHLRTYRLAALKGLLHLKREGAKVNKTLPSFFSPVRKVEREDLGFMVKPKNPLYIGNLRSGSSIIDVPVYLDGEKVFSHHILIPATTGKGKSNLCSVMLWQSVEQDYCGVLVLDPHDEYYGRTGLGLKDHPVKKVVYYTPKDAPPGAHTLRFNISLLKPEHFRGSMPWTDAQKDALISYYREYGEAWVEAAVLEKPLKTNMHEKTISVVKRRLSLLLGLDIMDDMVIANGVFDLSAGKTTITDICNHLEDGKTVIVDTSQFEGRLEILIGSLISTQLLARYRGYRTTGEIKNKPVISIFLEEAPRVLGKAVLEEGPNIFSTIAREGRKFKIGLTAITQLPSLIPRDILANMNTKLILGTEMKPERQALIESAAQDLSEDDRTIASLDTGECIVSSNFAKFATPVYVPLFKEYANPTPKENYERNYNVFN